MKNTMKMTELGWLPSDWEVVKLTQIGTITSGKRLPLGWLLTNDPTPYRYIRVTDMKESGIKKENLMFVPIEVADRIKKYRIFENEIYISVAGTLGIVGIVGSDLSGANLTENANKISCNNNVEAYYLLFTLKSNLIQNEIKSISTIGAQPKLALSRIRNFLIPLPPKPEQEAIAKVLSDTDALIESLEKLIEKKKLIKKGVMQDLLSGKKRLPGFAKSDQYKRTELGWLPSDWEVVNVNEIVELVKDLSIPNPKISFPYVGMEQVTSSTIQQKDTIDSNLSVSIKNKFKPNDTLFGKLRPYLKKITYAQISGVCSTEIWVLRSKTIPKFSFYVLSNHNFIRKVVESCTGTRMPRAEWSSVSQFPIPLPPKPEQEAIAKILSDIDASIEVLESRLSKTRLLKQGLMQQLLTGKIRLAP